MNTVAAFAVAFLIPFAACAAEQGRIHAPPDSQEQHRGNSDRGLRVVRYDEPFQLAYGRAVRIKGSETRARFVEVIEDSRCARGVECIQAGRARVRLEVWRDANAKASIDLGTEKDTSLASVGGVTWELQEVEPYPTAGEERRPERYTITLVAHPLR